MSYALVDRVFFGGLRVAGGSAAQTARLGRRAVSRTARFIQHLCVVA
jgi:hypothetical protein